MRGRRRTTFGPPVDALTDWLRAQRVGDLTPVDVRPARGEDSADDVAWFPGLVLLTTRSQAASVRNASSMTSFSPGAPMVMRSPSGDPNGPVGLMMTPCRVR